MNKSDLNKVIKGILSQSNEEDIRLLLEVMQAYKINTVDEAVKKLYKINNYGDYLEMLLENGGLL